MPNYEFQCTKCDHVFQELCEWEDVKKLRCVKCKSKRISQLFSPVTGIGLNSSFDYNAKKNFERAQKESATARAKSATPYRKIDDTRRGMNYTV